MSVLLAITSYNGEFYADGSKTGLYFTEALHPFQKFKAAGYEVTFVSETGTYGFDEHSIVKDQLDGDDYAVLIDKHSDFNQLLAKTKKASEVDSKDFDIFFAAGGHGACFDFPKADGLHKLALEIYAKNGVVSAVCHGPEIFDGLNDKSTGKPLIAGKKVTGFTDEGEKVLSLDPLLAKYKLKTCKQIYQEIGATYVEPEGPWVEFAVTDGRIVTGVNPQSAHVTAAQTIDAHKATA